MQSCHTLFARMATAMMFFVAAIFLPAMSTSALAQDTQVVRLSFAPGKNSRTVRNSIMGYEAVEYRIKVSAGQRMAVSMQTNNGSNYFNVTAPGAQQALHIGSIDGDSASFTVPSSGDYRIQVYLMRNAARRGETADFALSVRVTGSAGYDEGPAPGGDFADGLAGGPDFWRVANVPPGDRLNVRRAPSARAALVARVGNGVSLRNLGCSISAGQRWCRVGLPNGRTGWAAGRFLRE